MVDAANSQPYPHTAWGGPPQYAGNPWQGPPFWHPAGLSRPLGIAAIILGFVFWWPVGLALLFFMKWSGYMGCWGRRQRAEYANNGMQGPFQGWPPWKIWNAQPYAAQPQPAASSGNHAFDEYRTATIRRLEDEQQEFGSFLERLRFAKDKAEFDQFMTERRERPAAPSAGENRPNA
jgi:hypothetical protein